MEARPLPDAELVGREAQAGFVRRVAAVGMVVALLALILGLLPGYRVYRNNNGDCFGRALAGLAAHGDPAPCERSERYVGTEVAGGEGLAILMILVMVGGGAVWRWPRGASLAAWAALVWAVTVLALVATFELDLFGETRREPMAPAIVLPVPLAMIYLGIPIAAVVAYVIKVRARRRARRPELPRARIERGGGS